jgi:hypothetical protein
MVIDYNSNQFLGLESYIENCDKIIEKLNPSSQTLCMNVCENEEID